MKLEKPLEKVAPDMVAMQQHLRETGLLTKLRLAAALGYRYVVESCEPCERDEVICYFEADDKGVTVVRESSDTKIDGARQLNLLRELVAHHQGEQFGDYFFSLTDYHIYLDGVPAYLGEPLAEAAVAARKMALYMVVGFVEACRDQDDKSRALKDVWSSLTVEQRIQIDGLTLMLKAPDVPCGTDGYDVYRRGDFCPMEDVPLMEAAFLTYASRQYGCDVAADLFARLHPAEDLD